MDQIRSNTYEDVPHKNRYNKRYEHHRVYGEQEEGKEYLG